MKLKQQLDEFKDLKDEWNDLNKNMEKLYSLRLINNGCNPIYQYCSINFQCFQLTMPVLQINYRKTLCLSSQMINFFSN